MIARCPTCMIPRSDIVAHGLGDCPKWPAVFDVRRCDDCNAVTSFAYEIERRGKVRVTVRQEIR